MDWTERKVKFAENAKEIEYEKMSKSLHQEDNKLFIFMKTIKEELYNKYHTGEEIPEYQMPKIYKKMFNIGNLWKIRIGKEIVLYCINDKEILIIDIL